MIIINKQPRLYICAFMHKGEVAKVSLKPQENVVDDSLVKDLLKHPGFTARIDCGLVKLIDSSKPVIAPTDKNKDKAAKAAKEAEVKAKAEAEAKAKAEAGAAKEAEKEAGNK